MQTTCAVHCVCPIALYHLYGASQVSQLCTVVKYVVSLPRVSLYQFICLSICSTAIERKSPYIGSMCKCTVQHYYACSSILLFHTQTAVFREFPLPDPADLMTSAQLDFDLLHSEVSEYSNKVACFDSALKVVLKATPINAREPFKSRMEYLLRQGQLPNVQKVCKEQIEFTWSGHNYCLEGPYLKGCLYASLNTLSSDVLSL